MLTLRQLRTIPTTEDALATALVDLRSLGFDTSSWQPGSWQLSIARFVVDGAVYTAQIADAISRLCFNETSQGDALTTFSSSHYANKRIRATRAQHRIRLRNTSNATYNVTPGDFVMRESSTGNNLLFTATTGGVLSAGGTLELDVEAQVAGVESNVGLGAIDTVVTSLAGVTGVNVETTPGSGTSLVAAGAAAEGDEALRARNTSKWGTYSWFNPADGYAYFARLGSSSIDRVKVDAAQPRGPGTVDVYIATSVGAAGAGDVAAAQAQVDARHSGTPDPRVRAAAPTATAFSANIYLQSPFFDTVGRVSPSKEAEIESALVAYINGLAIGGTVLPPPDGNGVVGFILASEWQSAVTAIDGVANLGSPIPAVDAPVGVFDVPTIGSLAFTYVQVS